MQVCPAPNLRAVRPAGTQQALFLHAEEWVGAGNGCTLIWDGWDLRGLPHSVITATVPLDAFSARWAPLKMTTTYAMVRGDDGGCCGQITVEIPGLLAAREELDGLYVCVRYTFVNPSRPVDFADVFELKSSLRKRDDTGARAFRKRKRILRPYDKPVIVTALVTHRSRVPRNADEWPVLHDLPE